MKQSAMRVAYGAIVVVMTATAWRVTHDSPTSFPHASTSIAVSTPTTLPLTSSSTTVPQEPFNQIAESIRLEPLATGDLDGFVVTVDPGHNGANAVHPDVINQLVPDGRGTKACDTTGTATSNGFAESTFTFAVANTLATTLRQRGATVVLTRSNNSSVGPCVNTRAALGNGTDVAISIHGDAGPLTGRGFTILTPTNIGPSVIMTKESNRLAGMIRNRLENTYFMPSSYLGVDGIQPRSDLSGLNLSTTPKVFIECGNMKNSDDAREMQDPPWRDRFARTLADALAVFLISRS